MTDLQRHPDELARACADAMYARDPATQGLGITLLDAIESDDPTALIGLPLIRTARLLRAAGVVLP